MTVMDWVRTRGWSARMAPKERLTASGSDVDRAMTVVWVAAATSRRPAPAHDSGNVAPLVPRMGEAAVFMRAALMSRPGHSRRAWRTSAPAPATWGDAIDVPVMGAESDPDPARADSMDEPGADRSGLSRARGQTGPRELLSLTVSASSGNPMRTSSPRVTATPSANLAWMRSPSGREIMTAGMTMSSAGPLAPMTMGGPSTLLTTTTARAPVAWMDRILSRKKQVPRSTKAMLSRRSAALAMGSQARLGTTRTRRPEIWGSVARGGVNWPSTAATLLAMDPGESMERAPVPKPSS